MCIWMWHPCDQLMYKHIMLNDIALDIAYEIM